jgi:hypothetical protein
MNRGRFDTSDDEQLPRLAFLGRGSLSFHYTDRFTRSSSFGRALSAGWKRSRFRGELGFRRADLPISSAETLIKS